MTDKNDSKRTLTEKADSLVVSGERRDRRVGLTTELPAKWVKAVRRAKVPDEFAHLDAELN